MTLALDRAVTHAKKWLAGLDERPVATTVDHQTLLNRLGGPMPETGSAPIDVIDHLVTATQGGLMGNAGGRFFAWVIGGSTDSALPADWLATAWDQNPALHACAPAACTVEEVAGQWIKELLDLPREASFAFTTGCQLAHLTALAAARHAVLKSVGWNVEEEGLFGAPRVRVLASEQKHESVDRAVRHLGIGGKSIIPLGTDDKGRIIADELRAILDWSDDPTIVVLNAADLNIGACDDFRELIPIAKEAGAWVHVDGAFGLFARASRTRRHLVDGVDLADSWATDGHKWLNVPFDCGVAIVRDSHSHRAAMTQAASYLTVGGDARDPMDWNPEWSRRARAVPVYAALTELGRAGVETLIDRCCTHCETLVQGIGQLPGAEVVAEPTLNQGLVRFVRTDGMPDDEDTYTDRVIAAVNATGEAFFSGTTWNGKRAMRVSVVNMRTTETDVDRAIAAVASVLESE